MAAVDPHREEERTKSGQPPVGLGIIEVCLAEEQHTALIVIFQRSEHQSRHNQLLHTGVNALVGDELGHRSYLLLVERMGDPEQAEYSRAKLVALLHHAPGLHAAKHRQADFST